LTHDKQINPGARTVGSRADEEAQLGDCLVQLAIYSLSRNFNLADIYSIGVRRMEENVWRGKQLEITPRELRPKEIGYGISASSGTATGRVVVVRNPEDANKITEGKCIVAVPEYTKPVWDEIAARMDNVLGLISGTGSPNMHPAIVCRELKKPCIVSAKDLVDQLKDNEIVTVTVGKEMDENSVTRTNH
jgi:phosphohistidine swiveling domain-containing protein